MSAKSPIRTVVTTIDPSTVTSQTTSTATPTASGTPAGAGGRAMSTGAIIGIVVFVVLAALAGTILFMFVRRRRRQQQTQWLNDTNANGEIDAAVAPIPTQFVSSGYPFGAPPPQPSPSEAALPPSMGYAALNYPPQKYTPPPYPLPANQSPMGYPPPDQPFTPYGQYDQYAPPDQPPPSTQYYNMQPDQQFYAPPSLPLQPSPHLEQMNPLPPPATSPMYTPPASAVQPTVMPLKMASGVVYAPPPS